MELYELRDVKGRKLLGLQEATVADVAGVIPAGGTGAAAGGWDTAANRNTAITTIGEMKTQINAILTALKNHGLIAP